MDEDFIVDFGEVTRVTTEDFNKLNNRPSYAGELMTGDTDIPQVPSSVSELNNDSNYQTGSQVSEAIKTEKEAREAADTALDGRLTTVEGIAATALQPSSIDKVVMTDINVGANTSTTTFNLDASKQNLLTGVTSSKQVSMPVASSTEAGIMNSATFDAVVNNTANINALTNGAVAITGLPSSPTQAQLTTAWENATGETSLMNRAGIYDVTNGKVWTYYTNDTTWHSTTNTTQVTINTFTNSSEGTIKGSTNVGQIFAEADGTGSVNGWDALNDSVENNSSDISDLQTAVDGKQDKLIAGANINIAADGKTISATDTTYTAGNAIDITNGEISADIYPADFFTASDSVSDCGSNLSLDNTIATKLKSVELKGDTYQQTYSGKNLFPLNTGSYTNHGFTSVYNADGSITVSGTAEIAYANLTSNRSINWEQGKTYTFSITESLPCNVGAILTGAGSTREDINISAGNTNGKKTLNQTHTTVTLYIFGLTVGQSYSFTIYPMIEEGSTASPFEPYVGGVPSPNPDYPQDVQVVTGEQTIGITGKNLLDSSSYTDQYVNSSGNAVTGGGTNALFGYVPVSPSTQYTLSASSSTRMNFTYYDASKTFISRDTGHDTNSYTITTPDNCQFVRIWVYKNGGINQAIIDSYRLMLEKGSTVTDYTPFQGEQSYPISLGSIELCKIGDYQDYIYKSGDDWYVHKELAKYIFTGTEAWQVTPYGTNSWCLNNVIYFPFDADELQIISNIFTGIKNIDRNTAGSNVIYSASDSELNIRNTSLTSLAEVQAATNGNYVYYALANPTDTKITDATLVAQLNALAGGKSYNNQTDIVVTAAGENLPAILCVEAFQKSLNGLLGAIERLGE